MSYVLLFLVEIYKLNIFLMYMITGSLMPFIHDGLDDGYERNGTSCE